MLEKLAQRRGMSPDRIEAQMIEASQGFDEVKARRGAWRNPLIHITALLTLCAYVVCTCVCDMHMRMHVHIHMRMHV